MKKLIYFTLFSLSSLYASAQGSAIPTTVMQSFASLYPDAKDVAWSLNESSYEASFKLREKGVLLMFDESGFVNEIKNEIMLVELPLSVNAFVKREYPKWRVDKALHIDMNGTGYYETVLNKDKEVISLVFDRCGELMITVMP